MTTGDGFDSARSLPMKSSIWPSKRREEMYRFALENPEAFWAEEARRLHWYHTWDKVLEWNPPEAKWFVGGELNASYQCVDRHVRTWRKSKVAIYWEAEDKKSYVASYSTLFREVNRCASVLLKLGIKKGDRVVLYLPMIPGLPVAMLACARIGAIHSVVFSGFSAQALADRINDTGAKMVITADGGLRRGKIVPLKEITDEALKSCPTVESVLVAKRTKEPVPMKKGRDYWYPELRQQADQYVEPVPVESTHPLFILYTSGTTGKPKGILHSTGGYMVYNHSAYKWVFDIKEDSVYWCTADVGWVTGHSQIVYAPLSHGAATVIYEGAPDYPEIDRWWDIVEKYGVSIFYTSPTAVRMFMREGEKWLAQHDLSSLELLGSVGEPINPEAWQWYYKYIGGERCPIVDTWWQTETGGIMLSATPGIESAPLKPGSAGFPLPGVDVSVVDPEGNEMPRGQTGQFIIRKPWPGMLMGIYGDPKRYQETYWSQFPGNYTTGDFAMRDEDGYFWMLGRADEVLKVAGHRIGTAEIEDAAVSHPSVSEAAVTSKPDEVKGEAIVLFATLKVGIEPSDAIKKELVKHIRQSIGPIATPDEVHFADSLPKTRSGKIMRRVLKAVASGQSIGDVTTLENEASVEEVKKACDTLQKAVGGK